jgi:hypothetical protein
LEPAPPGNRLANKRRRIDAGSRAVRGGKATQSGEHASQGEAVERDVSSMTSRLIEPQNRGVVARERRMKWRFWTQGARITGEDHGSIS